MNNDIFSTIAVAGFLICLSPPPALAAAIPQQDYLPPIYPDYFVYKGLPDLPESYYDRMINQADDSQPKK